MTLQREKRTVTITGASLLRYFALTVLAVVTFAPIWFMATTSLKTAAEVFEFPPSLFPDVPQWSNYAALFRNLAIPRYMYNTFVVSAAAVMFNLAFDSMAAFAFARLRFPGKDVVFVALIASMIIPFQITMIPTFLIVKSFGWIDSYAGLIAPTAGGAFGIILLRQFMISFPSGLEDSARIDGAGLFRVYWNIVLPLTKPALATLAVLTFMFTWDDFLWPLIITNSDTMRTIQLGLQMLRGEYTLNWEILMAGSTVALIPVFVLFGFSQHFFVEGVTMSGIRG
jgi:multiple sugar transport system permease protein